MPKRKQDDSSQAGVKKKQAPEAETVKKHGKSHPPATKSSRLPALSKSSTGKDEPVSIQIVTGSYERVLHGFAAELPLTSLTSEVSTSISNGGAEQTKQNGHSGPVTFSDTFMFAAHSSAIRSLAVSLPTESYRRVLATGSNDERINLYNISTAPPKSKQTPDMPTLSNTAVVENSRNRELGSLLHHASSVTKLQFPTKGKLFSAAEDNTIAISRTRDWNVLSTIKVPIPKPMGRPSGDTAAAGEVPAGVNDFAIHPSMKLMVSVGKGEKCMRLWNLVTGKKAGVLNFDKDLLQQVGEGRYGSGEGRKVLWTEDGEHYVVGFEKGAAVFGMDSKPIATIKPHPPTKFHQMRFLPGKEQSATRDVCAISTEDGRILLYDLKAIATETQSSTAPDESPYPLIHPACPAIAQLGGAEEGVSGRIKDFEILQMPQAEGSESSTLLCIAGSSDGAVRLWRLDSNTLEPERTPATEFNKSIAKVKTVESGTGAAPRQVGTLVGMHDTGSRITCLAAFIMDGEQEESDERDLNGTAQNDDSSSDGEY